MLLPPVIITLPIAFRFALPVVVILLVVISPFANIILAGISPTEKPATEFKGLSAILFSYYLLFFIEEIIF